jgi:hypothetical protein
MLLRLVVRPDTGEREAEGHPDRAASCAFSVARLFISVPVTSMRALDSMGRSATSVRTILGDVCTILQNTDCEGQSEAGGNYNAGEDEHP